jgi:hypothetical protein
MAPGEPANRVLGDPASFAAAPVGEPKQTTQQDK